MKRILVLLAILMVSNSIHSQRRKPILNIQNEDKALINWGYYLGFNQYDFQFEYENDIDQDVLVDKTIGFNVGLIGELRLNEFLDVRLEPGLLYTCLLYTSPSPRDLSTSRMPSSA